MNDHTFCHHYLKEIMKEVRDLVPKDEIKKSWGWKTGFSDQVEFHGPSDFYWQGSGCCVWIAKARGWEKYLEKYLYKESATE